MRPIARIALAACSAATTLALTGCAGQPAAGSNEDTAPTSGETIIVHEGTPVVSTELTRFELTYVFSGVYGDADPRASLCHQGTYRAEVSKLGDGRARCIFSFSRPSQASTVSVEFTADAAALDELQQTLVHSGLAQLNGYAAYDSAEGCYVDVAADYASGEHLSIHGEGGASTIPAADVDALVVWMNELAEKNGVHFTRLYRPDQVTAALTAWVRNAIPDAPIDDELEPIVTCYEHAGAYTVRIVYAADGWLWYIDAYVDGISGVARDVSYRFDAADDEDPIDRSIEGTVGLFEGRPL